MAATPMTCTGWCSAGDPRPASRPKRTSRLERLWWAGRGRAEQYWA